MDAVVLLATAFAGIICSASAGGGFSKGRQFMLTFMHTSYDYSNSKSNNNVFLVIASNQTGTAHVVVAGDGTVPVWRNSYTIKAGETRTLSLPNQAVMSNTTTIEQKGTLVFADIDVSVYAMRQCVTVILPVASLSTNYVVPSVSGHPVMAISAVEDTTVTLQVVSNCNVSFLGRDNHGSTKLTLRLAEFDVFQMMPTYSNQSRCDFGSTRVIADRPVAVFSGSSCDMSSGTCGHWTIQVVPVDVWGRRFIIPDLASKGDYRVRIVSSVDSTYIYVYEHHIDNTIHENEIEMDEGSTRDVIVPDGTVLELFANRGIHVTQFDSGSTPFGIPVPSVEIYGWNYTVFAIDISGSHDYHSYVNIVAYRDSAKTLTIDGNLVRPSSWRRVHDLGYSVTSVPISRGSHTLEADDNFMVQVYGYNGVGSYGYLPGYYFKTLPSEHLSVVTAAQPTTTTTQAPQTVARTSCRDHPGVNCAILNVSIHICNTPHTGVHYCRHFCHMC